MTGRRILYAVALVLAFVFYLMYRQWFSWLFLLGILWLPVVSLLLSLPSMLTMGADLRCPEQVRRGVPAKTAMVRFCRLPHLPVKAVLQLQNVLTGDRYVGTPGEHVPTDRCGLVKVRFKTLKVYDCLGLFCKKIKNDMCREVYVLPRPIPTAHAGGNLETVSRWIPKAGGGFSENHDLRPYREGDNPRMIHWKLAAKTGKLIYREPIVPLQEETVLLLTLSGTPEEVERKLGRLLWLSRELTDKGIVHHIICRTGEGELRLQVQDLPAHERAMQRILASPLTEGEWDPQGEGDGALCVIGGAEDEA